jgi:Ni2+-binding GTPase involved in maturation of urease and hydrogenase
MFSYCDELIIENWIHQCRFSYHLPRKQLTIIILSTLEKHKVPTKYVTLIKDIYMDVVTFVRTWDGDTSDFPIKIGLHQGQL